MKVEMEFKYTGNYDEQKKRLNDLKNSLGEQIKLHKHSFIVK